MRRFFYKAFFLVDGLLKLLLPARRNQVCYSSIPDYTDNAYYMYVHALDNRSDLKHVWLVGRPETAHWIHDEFVRRRGAEKGHVLEVFPRSALSGYWAYLRSRYVFHTDNVYGFVRCSFRRVVVSLWHGMPIKRIGRIDEKYRQIVPAYGDWHLATSSFFQYVISCAFDVSTQKVLVSGLPRCEALRPRASSVNSEPSIRASLGVDEGARIVLWMPTFRTLVRQSRHYDGARSFLDDVPAELIRSLDRLAGEAGCVVVVKLHPYDALNYANETRDFTYIRFLNSEGWARIRIQLYELISISSAVISDVSSVLIDCLATTKPLGILGFDPSLYDRDLTFPIELLYASRRFNRLQTIEDIRSFLALASADAEVATESGDVATMLYENRAENACDVVLNRIGL